MNVLEKILAAARREGMNQAAFERWAGLPQGRVSKWRGGQSEPTWAQIVGWAREFGLSLDFLADDDLDSPPPPEITDEERAVLRMVRRIGVDEAERRLLNVPDDGATAPSYDPKTGLPRDPRDVPGRRGTA